MTTRSSLFHWCVAAMMAFVVTVPVSSAVAATRTWTGSGANSLWNTILNWSGSTPPGNGDNVFFPFTAGNKSSVNNLTVTNYGTIFFAGSNYVFSGSTIGLSGGIIATNRNGTNTFATPLQLRASQTFTNGDTFGGTLQIAGSLNLNGNDLTLQGGGDVRVVSSVFGGGDIIKGGFGDLILQAANTFTGVLYVALGRVYVRHPLALGDTNFPVVVTNLTRRVFLGTNIVVTNKSLQLGIQSELWGEGGTNGWTGPIALTGTDPFLRLDNGGETRLDGIISGAGNWHVVGPGTAVIQGPQANTATGDWDLNTGATLLLNKTPGLASGHRYIITEGSTVRLLASEQLSNTRSLILSDGTLDLNGFTDTIAFLTDSSTNGSGRLLFGSSGTNALIFGSTSTTSIFSGTLSGAGDSVKIGGSTHILRGTNSSTGNTIVGNGALAVDGRITALTIVTNGMLTGTGRVGVVTLNGANGILNPGLGSNTTARLTIAGASSWLAGKVQLELNGPTPITQHDQIQIDAPLGITNCALQVTLGFAPALGDSFVIVTNTAAGRINGNFAGLPEGAVLNVGGTLLRISYLGGTGNDVTLRVVDSVTSTFTQGWTGTGANNFWLTPANWFASRLPGGGESLVFPPGAARFVNTNDYPPDTVFNSILLGTNGYDLRGHGITLLGGITSTNASGVNIIRLPLALGTNQTFAMTRSGGTLNILAPIDVGPHQLSINATGAVITSGAISGSGSLVKIGANEFAVLGTNSLAGTNFINEGSLFVSGAITGRTALASGTMLSGLGFVGQLQCASGSTLTGGDLPDSGRLRIGNELRLTNGSAFIVKINGPVPDIGYDQIAVTNTSSAVVLSNATLQVNLNFTPVGGSTFTIIDKAGTGAISGTFNGLPEGAFFNTSNVLFQISYVGGTGNDVVLTVLSSNPTGITRAWTGAAFPNTNWSNPTNWTGSILPAPGDALFFSGALPDVQKTNIYDLAAGTVFDRLTFGDGQCRYRIFGATPLLLANGILVTNTTFGPSFTVPLELIADQTFSNTGPSGLRVTTVRTGGHQLIFDGDGSFVVDGDVSGAGALVKRGAGPLRFNAATTFTGSLDVQAGSIEVNSTASLGSTGTGATVAEVASLVLVSSSHNFGEPLTLAGTLSGGTTTNNTWSGPITFVAPDGTVDVGAGGALRITTIIGGNGGLIKTGAGTLTLAATNTFSGTTLVQAGMLLANAIHTNSPVTVNNTATLGGTGSVASVTVNGGTLAPGAGGTVGTLQVRGNLVFDAGGTLALQVNDLAPGTGYDQLVVAGDVQLAGPPPVVTTGFRPAVGDTFVIIRNDGSNAVSGTFAGLAQGDTFVSGTANWQANYAGGDGNDVVLSVVPFTPSGLTQVWTGGGGGNTNWSNPTNWLGGVAPMAGDSLIFPSTSGFRAFNDFPPSVIFDQLRLGTGTSSLLLLGNEVPLLSGLVVTNAGFSPFVITPIRLLTDQSVAVENGSVALTKIFTDGHQLTFEGNGDASVSRITVNGVPFNGDISGAGGVIKRGSGTLTMNATNTYTGSTAVEAGVVEIQTGSALGAASSGTTVLPGAILRLRTTTTVNEPLALSGTLEVPSFVAGGIWSGPVTLSAAGGALINTSNSQPLRLTGVVSGPGGFTKTGPGVLTLEADNNYSGATVVESGTLVVTNSHLTGPLAINGSNSTLLAGGQVGPVTSTGALLAAGTLTTPATVDVVGSFSLDADTQFNVDLNGPASGSNYDQWRVAGNVSLSSASLNLAIRTVPTVGSTFIIIRNDSANPVSGTFVGLPQGSQFTRGNFIWLITYAGGDGNDVALIVIGQTVLGRVWDGAGANSNWMTALNWVGDTVPATGVNLIFPTEAANRTNFNDFPAGTGFNSLNFTGATNSSALRYTVLGNTVTLTNGLVCESNASSTTFGIPLSLASAAPIRVDSPASITFTNGINTVGFNLNLAGSGSLIFNTPIVSDGGLMSSAGFVQLRSNNTFAGSSLISTGTVRVDATGAFGSSANTLTIDSNARLQLQNATSMTNPLILRGRLEAFRTNTWSGPVTTEGTNAIIGFPGSGPLTIAGTLSGSGELGIASSVLGNHVELTGTNSYAGRMRLTSGTLIVNGVGTSGAIDVATNQTFFPTVLAGTGTVSSVFAAGTISPAFTNAGFLNVAGNLVLSNTAIFDVQINGPGSGTGHDQLRVAGDVRIENAALQLLQPPSFLPNLGDTFVIIRNDGPNPVNGTFAGLPQGGMVTNCAVFQITYTGGDGNDVALVVTAQKGMVSQWTGNGGDTNWTNGANWLCGLPPDPGDTLIFSNGIPNRITHNNFPPGTTFARLSFRGFNFDQPFFLGGNPITLTHGIDGYFSGSNVISMPITMNAPQTFSNAFGLLALRGGVTNGGHELALTGGTFDFVGPYVGAGGISFINTNSFSFGQLILRTNNPYSGPTVLLGSVYVPVYTPGGLGDGAAGTSIGPGASVDLQVPMTFMEPITLAGRLDFANGSNVMAAPLTLEGSNLLMCISGPRMEFNGPINGSGLLQACGISTNFYNAGGAFAGTVEIFAGQHTFIGEYPSMDLVIGGTINFSSTIAGTGSVAGIVASDASTNSVIAPGVNGPGVLTVGGRFIVESNITLRMELNSTTPGIGHDQLVIGGPVALTNCTLELSLGFAPALGDSFRILDNTGPNSIAGVFNGLPQGAMFTLSNQLFSITYTGGDGNDVVVTCGNPPARFSSIALSDGVIQLQILGQPGAAQVIEAATNLLSPSNLTPWLPISTNTADGVGLLLFLDPDATNFLQRFYRVRSH